MKREFRCEELKVNVFTSREEMGVECGKEIEAEIQKVIKEKGECRIIFAAAPSQNDVLKYLRESKKIDFSKIVCFHMDEYHTLPGNSDKRFKYFLDQAIFKYHSFKAVNYLCDQENEDIVSQIKKYEGMLCEKEIDICLLGVGENGHLAFNDPPVADFKDPKVIKEVKLDEVCRNQQFHDAKFTSIDLVPRIALTLTIPTLLKSKKMYCIAPTVRKKDAIYKTLYGEISTKCPSSILRKYPNCTLYIDEAAYTEEK